MNLPNVPNLAVNRCISLVGDDISMVAYIRFEFSFIPLRVLIYPKNFPSVSLSKHFIGLSFMPYLAVSQRFILEFVCDYVFLMS